jgi:pyrroline-5-carboxylate reductase
MESIGFIGAGRCTRILLGGLERAGKLPGTILASDPSAAARAHLQQDRPFVRVVGADNRAAARAEVVFLSLHPPVFETVLREIATGLRPEQWVVSLAPKITLAQLTAGLGGHARVARFLPNAPSIVNRGHNPLAIAETVPPEARVSLRALLGHLGTVVEVSEAQIEAYALTAAMGPTYHWFQWQELIGLAEQYGMTADQARATVREMLQGALATFFDAGIPATEVMDLVPVRPLAEDEETIRTLYRTRLATIRARITP